MFDRTKLRSAAARLLYNDDRDIRDYNLLVEFIDAMCIDPQGNIRLDYYQQKNDELESLLAMARSERDTVTKRMIELEQEVARERKNREAIRMRYIAADTKGTEKAILGDVLRLLEDDAV